MLDNKVINRYLDTVIKEFLSNRMVFIGGPRQVGKTTLCLQFIDDIKNIESPAYLNWDSVQARSMIKKSELPVGYQTIIFDEIHKYKFWRTLLKGLYDTKKTKYKFIITGSARLDHYRKGGDSLLGR